MYGDTKTNYDRTNNPIEKKWTLTKKIVLTIVLLALLLGAMYADHQALQIGLIN